MRNILIPMPGDTITLAQDCFVNIIPLSDNAKFMVQTGISQYFTVDKSGTQREEDRVRIESDLQKKGNGSTCHNIVRWKGITLTHKTDARYYSWIHEVTLPEKIFLPANTQLQFIKFKKERVAKDETVLEFQIMLMDGVAEKTKLVLRIPDVNDLVVL